MNTNWTAWFKHTNKYCFIFCIVFKTTVWNTFGLRNKNCCLKLSVFFLSKPPAALFCSLSTWSSPVEKGFFGSQVNVFVSFSLRPKLIPLSVNQWNRLHAFGLRLCSCTPLVRIKLPFSGSVRTVPSPWQTQGHVSLSDNAYDIGQRWGSLNAPAV